MRFSGNPIPATLYMVARMSGNTKYSVNNTFIPAFCSHCDRKMTRNFTSPDMALPCAETPLHPLHFPEKDQTSLHPDPVAAATFSNRKQDADSVKGWFMKEILTPDIVCRGCG